MSRRVLSLRSDALMRFSAIRSDPPGPHRKRRSDFFPRRRHERQVFAARPQGQYVEISFGCPSIIRPESEPSRRDK